MTDCFYTSTEPFDLTNRILYNPPSSRYLMQDLTPVSATTTIFLQCDTVAENVILGFTDAGILTTGPANINPGFDFRIKAPNPIETVNNSDSFTVTIEEPFNLRSLVLYPPSDGRPTRPLSILSSFFKNASTSTSTNVDYVTETPLFHEIDTTGDITVRSFRFRLTGPSGTERILLDGALTLQLLIRSPRPIYTR
jgi:hypothetical protein